MTPIEIKKDKKDTQRMRVRYFDISGEDIVSFDETNIKIHYIIGVGLRVRTHPRKIEVREDQAPDSDVVSVRNRGYVTTSFKSLYQ